MDEEETKRCDNCKREIPVSNHTIHSVHCARNLRLCPVCKEPVPTSQLTEHHDTLHKPLPCKQCGESVCGTDLEDHIRDSCGHTTKSCRYCELELPRRDIPVHESYCGTRTEQCADCREWVMLKYRPIHLQSNHGFLRLDDDPIPQPPKPNPPKANNIPKPTSSRAANIDAPIQNGRPSTSNSVPIAETSRQSVKKKIVPKNLSSPSVSNGSQPNASIATVKPNTARSSTSSSRHSSDSNPSSSSMIKSHLVSQTRPSSSNTPAVVPSRSMSNMAMATVNNVVNGPYNMPKRANDQHQNNNNVHNGRKINKASSSRSGAGAVKKRPAPPPPARDPIREAALCSALNRYYEEQAAREQQNQYNREHGLPPVLSAAAKLDKLRRMDQLHNREAEDDGAWRNKMRGQVWMDHHRYSAGNVLGSELTNSRPNVLQDEPRRNNGRPTQASGDRRNDFKDLKPMSSSEFAARFSRLQLDGASGVTNSSTGSTDRFSEIKSSLHALRRGLNEVTAPYVSNPNPPPSPVPEVNLAADLAYDDDVQLPCEFCGLQVPAMDLVLHQTGCCPDLVQRRPNPSPPPAASPAPPLTPLAPLIPCEFCPHSLPVYLIAAHQEQCRRRNGGDEIYTDSD